MKAKRRLTFGVVTAVAVLVAGAARAAQGEMGAGVPQDFGMYSAATGTETYVWALSNVASPFPAGCSWIKLTPNTMGMDGYKIALAALMTAKTANRRIRFYAHAPRDGGCGVDYLQMFD